MEMNLKFNYCHFRNGSRHWPAKRPATSSRSWRCVWRTRPARPCRASWPRTFASVSRCPCCETAELPSCVPGWFPVDAVIRTSYLLNIKHIQDICCRTMGTKITETIIPCSWNELISYPWDRSLVQCHFYSLLTGESTCYSLKRRHQLSLSLQVVHYECARFCV